MPQHDNTPRDDRWKIGDKALCIKNVDWRRVYTGEPVDCPCPEFGKQYTIKGFRFFKERGLFLKFEELPKGTWAERHFMKATPTEDLVDEERVVSRTDRKQRSRCDRIVEKV